MPPVAAATPSADNSIVAAGNRLSRPIMVHPPSTQQLDPRDTTPNPKRSRRGGKNRKSRGNSIPPMGQESKSNCPPLQATAPTAAASPQGPGNVPSGPSTATSAANKELNQVPKAAAAKGKKKGASQQQQAAPKGTSAGGPLKVAGKPGVPSLMAKAASGVQPSKAAPGSISAGVSSVVACKPGTSRQKTTPPSGVQQVPMQSAPPSSSTAFDPSDGHHIDEQLLRKLAGLSPRAPWTVITTLTSKLPKDFYGTLKPRQRFEAAREVWDSRQRQRIDDEKDAARRASIVADNARVESEKRVADLTKQLEAAKRDNDAKTMDAQAAVERSAAAMATKFTTASNVRPQRSQASSSVTATPKPAASSEKTSQPASLSAKDAPKPVNSKGRTRSWNKK